MDFWGGHDTSTITKERQQQQSCATSHHNNSNKTKILTHNEMYTRNNMKFLGEKSILF